MNVHVLPTPRAAQAAAAGNPRNADTCGIFDVAGRLGQAHRTVGVIVRTIDKLIEAEDFPAPFPTLSRGRLVAGAHPHSRWPRVAIEAWFDDRLPPQARGLMDTAERAATDSRLAARAARLFAEDAA